MSRTGIMTILGGVLLIVMGLALIGLF